jgi:hypothetical protein
VESYELVFSVHAGLRMSKWSIDEEDIQIVVDTGDVIEEYAHALPLPCRLMIGKTRGQYIHVVVAKIEATMRAIIITAYVPDPTRWEPDLRTRRKK